MPRTSRRAMLLGGGLALGAAVTGSLRPTLDAGAGTTTVDASPTTGAALQLGATRPFATFAPLPNRPVMQDFVYLPRERMFFVTQNVTGSSGSYEPLKSTVISRIRYSDGRTLDMMLVVDGGHGLGFEIEMQGDQAYVWMTWAGSSAASGGRENDFVRFRYRPGTWDRVEAARQLDLVVLPLQDRTPEAVYHFDPVTDWAVERRFNWASGGRAPSETYKRRRLSDIRKGVDRTFGEVTLAASPPLTQGFATLGDTLLRWSGATVQDDSMDTSDPVRLQQYDWSSGRLVAAKNYTMLSQSSPGRWRDGVLEPQGMCVFREADGTVSLLVGDVTGDVGNRAYHVSKVGDLIQG